MPQLTCRGDPYEVLGVAPGASDQAIQRRRRELARELHPDQATGDAARTADLTKRMARVNAAYDLLRDEERRRAYDRSHPNARSSTGRTGSPPVDRDGRPSGPPPPRPTRPVTARFDATGTFHARNATTTNGSGGLPGHRPISARERTEEPEPLRASKPNGPVRVRRTRRPVAMPTLEASLAAPLEFGKFRGHTLGEVAAFEPTYIDWIARTITRDRDLVVKARVIQAELDERGVVRRMRPPTAGFGTSHPDD